MLGRKFSTSKVTEVVAEQNIGIGSRSIGVKGDQAVALKKFLILCFIQ